MDNLFNKKPWVNPEVTLDSGSPFVIPEDDVKDVEDNVKESVADKPKLPPKRKYYN